MSAAISTPAQRLVHEAAMSAGDCCGNADAANSMAASGSDKAKLIERLEWALEQANTTAQQLTRAISSVKTEGGAA